MKLIISILTVLLVSIPAFAEGKDSYLRHLDGPNVKKGEAFDLTAGVHLLLTYTQGVPLCYLKDNKNEACTMLSWIIKRSGFGGCTTDSGEKIHSSLGVKYKEGEFKFSKDIGPCPADFK